MKGFNNGIIGRDHNYGYNGIEESNELDNNMLEMDLRQYDPAIARWVVQDPITHHDYSPYQAFDNNPIFWADPSGADSQITDDGNAISFRGEAAGQAFAAIRDGLSYVNDSDENNNDDNDNDDNDTDPEEAQWIRADARNFAHDAITYTYELVNDEKNIHKITLKGMSWIVKPGPPYYGYRRYRESIIEVIIESNKGNPRVVSSIMTNGIYSWGKCDEGHYHNLLEDKLKIEENYKSPLTNYVTNKMLNALNANPDYNPFNGTIESAQIIASSTAGIGYLKHVTKYETSNKIINFFFNKIPHFIIAVSGANLYRNYADHSGKTIEFKLK